MVQIKVLVFSKPWSNRPKPSIVEVNGCALFVRANGFKHVPLKPGRDRCSDRKLHWKKDDEGNYRPTEDQLKFLSEMESIVRKELGLKAREVVQTTEF